MSGFTSGGVVSGVLCTCGLLMASRHLSSNLSKFIVLCGLVTSGGFRLFSGLGHRRRGFQSLLIRHFRLGNLGRCRRHALFRFWLRSLRGSGSGGLAQPASVLPVYRDAYGQIGNLDNLQRHRIVMRLRQRRESYAAGRNKENSMTR